MQPKATQDVGLHKAENQLENSGLQSAGLLRALKTNPRQRKSHFVSHCFKMEKRWNIKFKHCHGKIV